MLGKRFAVEQFTENVTEKGQLPNANINSFEICISINRIKTKFSQYTKKYQKDYSKGSTIFQISPIHC